jgi:hypothetical protein
VSFCSLRCDRACSRAIGVVLSQASVAVAFALALALCLGSIRSVTAPALRLT